MSDTPNDQTFDALLKANGLAEIARAPLEPSDGFGAGDVRLIGLSQSGWAVFRASSEAQDGAPDPLDRWSARIGSQLAVAASGRAVGPSDGPPFPPIVKWALRSGRVFASPIGLLCGSETGLWFSVRVALLTPSTASSPKTIGSPCGRCAVEPCRSACPAGAFGPSGYDVAACIAEIDGPDRADCARLGCAARRVCPAGRAAEPTQDQKAFHMDAFLDARRAARGDAG